MKAVIKHTATLYEALKEQAIEENIQKAPYQVFRGKITHLFSTTGIGASYYSQIIDQLERQGCITYLQRGAKNVDTIIVLHHPPSAEAYESPPKRDLTSAEEFANMIETVRFLKTTIGGIDIVETIRELDARLARLEAKVSNNTHNNDTTGENT